MKRIVFLLLAVFLSCASLSEAGFVDWYKNLLKGLDARLEKAFVPKVRITAVAAVRGAEQSADPMRLYWKGGISEKAARKLKEEEKQFAEAVRKVVGGNAEEGRKLLEKFLKDNPESPYVKDVKEAISRLPEEEATPGGEKEGSSKKTGGE